MAISSFDPPGYLTDFNSVPSQRNAWTEIMSYWFDEAIQRAEESVGVGRSQYYNPSKTDTQDPNSEKVIRWLAFPRVIAQKHGADKVGAWKEAEQLISRSVGGRAIRFRPQDEYCEWFVTRDPRTNKIKRVVFTCEGPEYWAALAQGYPNDYAGPRAAGAAGDKQLLLQLYQQFVSPNVQMGDLFAGANYDQWNKWNTTDGAMHLTHPANALEAEILIAGDATVLRAKNGTLLTDQDLLICCAAYGTPQRASDPRIGGDVNTIARLGAAITLANPVGLYMDGLDTTGWTKPDKSPIGNYWTVLRGANGMAVRAAFEVPNSEAFTVSDIQIGGQAIEYGGQIAEHITMKLTGVACRVGQFHDSPVSCVSSPPPGCPGSQLHAAAHFELYAKALPSTGRVKRIGRLYW